MVAKVVHVINAQSGRYEKGKAKVTATATATVAGEVTTNNEKVKLD